MKRKLILISALVIVGSAFALSTLPDSSIDYNQFQTRFHHAIERANLRDLTPTKIDDASVKFNPEEVSVPWNIRWNPRQWYPRTASTIPPFWGTTGGNLQSAYKLGDGSSAIVCTAVLLDGRISFIHIRAQTDSAAAVESLQSTLGAEFPGLPIKVDAGNGIIRG